ncbi:hypothetical protein FW778_22865, partial [Ginsengibacter hankyongi]
MPSKKVVIILSITLFFGTTVLADYTINTGVTTDPATTPLLLNATGTISIYGTMAINSNVTFTSATPLTILVYGTGGTIQWNNNCTLAFPAGTTITYINNPTAPPGLQGTPASASKILQIGGVKYASANDNSNNVVFDFTQLNSIGGTATINATTSTPSVCSSSVASFSANELLPSGVAYYIQWISSAGGTFSDNNTISASNTSLTGMSTGQDTVFCNLYANSGGSTYYSVSTDTVLLTVNAIPQAPTASLTQPTCSTSTGTITITAPTGAGMTYSTNGVTYTNTTGFFSGTAAGSYSLTAKNSSGCVSSITPVTINAPPATPAAPTASVTAQPSCTVATGNITITAPTGAGMTYSTDGITYTNTTGIFSGMASGSYSLTAKNGSGCVSSMTSVTVNAQPARATGSLSGSASICSGSSASLNIAVTGAGT